MSKIQEYLKAIGAAFSVVLLGVVASVTEAIETEGPALKTAVAAFVTGIVVAILRNKPRSPVA